eukprot:CAMPEP_0194129686 /NCGR_PEP_ID=MMETSP0152-20130528/895_1 /TAXON_ID=1049557 /ORGANISM="Thalassiothrix antarctica, Strain L6-D1" /LENGTH=402 /DNA_ID=CAMNT_0038823995 /DNA_START=295 /DNA_END=1503 /DNA_ORIENTATION=+
MATQAGGERPAWAQRPLSSRRLAAEERFPFVVEDAEVVLSDDTMQIAEAQEIVRAIAVVESRMNGFNLRNLNPMVRRRRRREVQMAQAQMTQPMCVTEEQHPESTSSELQARHAQVQQDTFMHSSGESPVSPSTEMTRIERGDDSVTLQGSRRTTASLLDDDSTDEEPDFPSRDRIMPQPGVQSTSIYENEEFDEMHPHVQSVLEVFPDTNVARVQELLRQESLSTTFITLAEESSAAPSDSVACPTELQHTTTYAQANDENRAIIMSYLMEMFPHIPMKKIEKVVMKYSTHKGVAILSGEGERLNPTVPASPPDQKCAPIDQNRPYRQKSNDNTDFNSINKEFKELETSIKQTTFKKQKSSTYDPVLERVLRESAEEEERRQARLQENMYYHNGLGGYKDG